MGGPQARAPGAASTLIVTLPYTLRAQAFSTPPWFRDDWLNGFHDLLRARRAPPGGAAAAAPLRAGAAAASDAAGADGGDAEGGEAGAAAGPRGGLATSDFRFLYLGPAGSHTPLHADVLRSFSWRARGPAFPLPALRRPACPAWPPGHTCLYGCMLRSWLMLSGDICQLLHTEGWERLVCPFNILL